MRHVHLALLILRRVGDRSAKGDGRWNHADLAGHVKEWALDFNGFYPAMCADGAQSTDQGGSNNRILRRGAFNDGPDSLTSFVREPYAATGRNTSIGFRCAR